MQLFVKNMSELIFNYTLRFFPNKMLKFSAKPMCHKDPLRDSFPVLIVLMLLIPRKEETTSSYQLP